MLENSTKKRRKNMFKKIALFSVMLMFMVLIIGVSMTSGVVAKTNNFALILATGGLGDQSFNDLTYEGMVSAKKELGIKFDYVEPKAISNYEIYQSEMAASGDYELIITVGFDQADALTNVAKDYPNQKFAIIDMVVDLPNVASYVSEEQEGSFLVGALAGLLKKEGDNQLLNNKHVTGVVGGMDIPLIRKFIAGYMAGVKYVNPEMKVVYDYVGNWSDPTTAKEIALSMHRIGADIIYHAAGGSGLGVFQAAQQEKFMTIGVNSNQNYIAPDYIVASMLKRVDYATYSAVQDVLNDSFRAGVHSLGIKQGGIGYTTEKSNINVSNTIIKKVEELKGKIERGELVVPVNIEDVEGFLVDNK